MHHYRTLAKSSRHEFHPHRYFRPPLRFARPCATKPRTTIATAWIIPIPFSPLNWLVCTLRRTLHVSRRCHVKCETTAPNSSHPPSVPSRSSPPPSPSPPPPCARRSDWEPELGPEQQAADNGNDQAHDPVTEVELRDVYLDLGGQSIIQGLDLKVCRGESLALIGSSGTGKSTTLRLVCGLLMPTSGEKMPRVSMVFQNAALFDSLTVAENLELTLEQYTTLKAGTPEMTQVVHLWLSRVGLDPSQASKSAEVLSGGMKKRVSFARAVCFDPKHPETAPDILLFDEPTAGLDPTASTRIENLICDLRPYCATSIIVTHQYSTIRRTADRVVFLHGGRAVWDGPTHSLDTSKNPFVRQFMGASLDGPLSGDF